uniref:MLP-like protein 328 n=1 Tax=Rhizophora mucronata TaxID=61149 RepID=A0A2P2K152_RHIMU
MSLTTLISNSRYLFGRGSTDFNFSYSNLTRTKVPSSFGTA